MKKYIIATLAVVALLGFAGSSFALLCASDPVPAGTLLFPFCTAKYDATATASDPKVDYNSPVTYFAITNVSSSARIVHLVLWNDMSYPLLDWDVLLTGYDVITFNFGRILEGYLVATGPATNPATGRPYSPTGTQPVAQGPVPSYYLGIPSLPAPQGVGTTANNTSSIFGLCTNPIYTQPYTVNPGNQANRIIPGNLSRIFNGMRQSQRISENGWWGYMAGGSYDYIPPDWLTARSTSDSVWGYITADVVTGCGFGFPSTEGYFATWAYPATSRPYMNGTSTFWVDMGNTLIGDWFVVDQGGNAAQGNPAVHIEMDNYDVDQTTIDSDGDFLVDYPKAVALGRSFYRYAGIQCNPGTEPDDVPSNCHDYYTGTGQGEDYVTGGDYFFGNRMSAPAPDYREPLPSAFAFRWMQGGGFDGGTKIRVWKEIPDLFPYYGFTYVYSGLQYSYYAWDEEEHVVAVSGGGCDYSPCSSQPPELNELPLEVQEVDVNVFKLPKTYMTFGWALFAFMGSNTLLFDDWSSAGGYNGGLPAGYGTQAWIEVLYTASGRFSVDFNAAVLGNFLCDGLAVTASPRTGWDVTDLGDVLY